MSEDQTARCAAGNRLLARLPPDEYQRLLPRLQLVPLELKHVLYEARSSIDYAYFPNRGVVSALTVMEDGRAIEVATIGDEGMVGLPLLVGAKITANRVIVQVPGDALRMAEDVLREEVSRDSPLRRLLVLYHTAFLAQVSQAVACNGLHSVHQRCCRWLLMTQDRAHSDVFPMTHELLAEMLGVRRSTVSEVLEPLKETRLDTIQPGEIHRPRPGGSEGRFLRVLPGDHRGIRAIVRLSTKGKAQDQSRDSSRGFPVCRKAYRRLCEPPVGKNITMSW